jgi:hypothetical protein
MGSEKQDWLRNVVQITLTVVLCITIYQNIVRLMVRQIGMTEETKNSFTLLYPSVTMCPVTIGPGSSTADLLEERFADLNFSGSLLCHTSF